MLEYKKVTLDRIKIICPNIYLLIIEKFVFSLTIKFTLNKICPKILIDKKISGTNVLNKTAVIHY